MVSARCHHEPEIFAQLLGEVTRGTVVALVDLCFVDIRLMAHYRDVPLEIALERWCRGAARVAEGR
jgi:hypothetical protein